MTFSNLFSRTLVVLAFFSASTAFALTHNTNSLPGTSATDKVLVQNGNVAFMTTDYGGSGNIVWQLQTTDNTSGGWSNNECSANAPHSSGHVVFAVNATVAGTDNKLQKLMTVLQEAQLTGMQITVIGASVTGNPASDCILNNITHVYLRNTTF